MGSKRKFGRRSGDVWSFDGSANAFADRVATRRDSHDTCDSSSGRRSAAGKRSGRQHGVASRYDSGVVPRHVPAAHKHFVFDNSDGDSSSDRADVFKLPADIAGRQSPPRTVAEADSTRRPAPTGYNDEHQVMAELSPAEERKIVARLFASPTSVASADWVPGSGSRLDQLRGHVARNESPSSLVAATRGTKRHQKAKRAQQHSSRRSGGGSPTSVPTRVQVASRRQGQPLGSISSSSPDHQRSPPRGVRLSLRAAQDALDARDADDDEARAEATRRLADLRAIVDAAFPPAGTSHQIRSSGRRSSQRYSSSTSPRHRFDRPVSGGRTDDIVGGVPEGFRTLLAGGLNARDDNQTTARDDDAQPRHQPRLSALREIVPTGGARVSAVASRHQNVSPPSVRVSARRSAAVHHRDRDDDDFAAADAVVTSRYRAPSTSPSSASSSSPTTSSDSSPDGEDDVKTAMPMQPVSVGLARPILISDDDGRSAAAPAVRTSFVQVAPLVAPRGAAVTATAGTGTAASSARSSYLRAFEAEFRREQDELMFGRDAWPATSGRSTLATAPTESNRGSLAAAPTATAVHRPEEEMEAQLRTACDDVERAIEEEVRAHTAWADDVETLIKTMGRDVAAVNEACSAGRRTANTTAQQLARIAAVSDATAAAQE